MLAWNFQIVRPCSAAVDLFAQLGFKVEDYWNYVVDEAFIVCFVWDTREVQLVIDLMANQHAGNYETYTLALKLEHIKLCPDSKEPLKGELPKQCKVLACSLDNSEVKQLENSNKFQVLVNGIEVARLLRTAPDFRFHIHLHVEDGSWLKLGNAFHDYEHAYSKFIESYDYIINNFKLWQGNTE